MKIPGIDIIARFTITEDRTKVWDVRGGPSTPPIADCPTGTSQHQSSNPRTTAVRALTNALAGIYRFHITKYGVTANMVSGTAELTGYREAGGFDELLVPTREGPKMLARAEIGRALADARDVTEAASICDSLGVDNVIISPHALSITADSDLLDNLDPVRLVFDFNPDLAGLDDTAEQVAATRPLIMRDTEHAGFTRRVLANQETTDGLPDAPLADSPSGPVVVRPHLSHTKNGRPIQVVGHTRNRRTP